MIIREPSEPREPCLDSRLESHASGAVFPLTDGSRGSASDAPLAGASAGDRLEVLIVGGGVSGCACAASLAVAGARVILVNSALDVLGLPGHGPALLPCRGGGWSEIGQVLGGLPSRLRWAWLCSASVPIDGSPCLLVDRRAVSLETKRALEGVVGIEFRQGLVVDVRPAKGGAANVETSVTPAPGSAPEGESSGRSSGAVQPDRRRVEVVTAFGEVFAGDVAIIAVGLGLGGRILVGDDSMAGGRYGEVAADLLMQSLEDQGVKFQSVEVDEGRRISGSRLGSLERAGRRLSKRDVEGTITARSLTAARPTAASSASAPLDDGADRFPGELLEAREALLRVAMGTEVGDAMERDSWRMDYPLAPHRMDELRRRGVVLHLRTASLGANGSEPLVSPDGGATGELYVSGEGLAILEEDLPAARLEHVITAEVIADAQGGGRVAEIDGVWVVGQAAGAKGYLDSLQSGIEVARAIMSDYRTQKEHMMAGESPGASRPRTRKK
ncbi:MAG TPA: FAD-dependent oxidoreductase [Thermoleophilia bacterium]